MLLAASPAWVHAQTQPAPKALVALEYRPLSELLNKVLKDELLSGALVSAKVSNLSTGETLFAKNPHLLVNPASVSKIFTTAAALCLLHPDYRFKTEIYALKKPEKGVIQGPIYLKGYGDPYLVTERLVYLASELKALGITKIDGSLILDDTHFDPKRDGPGWSQDASYRPYQAPMGALSLNFNSVAILVFPAEQVGKEARIELMPDSDHFVVENKVKTSKRGTRVRIKVSKKGRNTKLVLRGKISVHHPGTRQHARVIYPTWYTGYTFRQALKSQGIKTKRYIRRGKVPRYADLLYTLKSPSLGELVRKVNKRSQNFMAEQLLKIMGAEYLGPPASWFKGQQVIAALLEEEIGIPQGTTVLHNGSGLNDVNRITVSQTNKLLKYMWGRFDVRPDFLGSLAVAGADGTVTGRFKHPALARTMRLKTGSLSHTRALAGYVKTSGNEMLAFSIFISRYSCKGYKVTRLIDRFASALSRANIDRQVVLEVKVEPIPPVASEKTSPITPAGPQEGNEEFDIPKCEQPNAAGS